MDKNKIRVDPNVQRSLSQRYKGLPTSKRASNRADKLISARDSVNSYQSSKEIGDSSLLRQKFEGGVFNDYDTTSLSSLEGFAALAERKILAARRAGQFKNLPGKGKPAEHDHLASSPHLDSTEYFLNRIIKRQGAKPLWIQAQNDLNDAMEHFRKTLQDDWKRHVARRISSQGGSLDQHMKWARQFAESMANNTATREHMKSWEDRENGYHALQIKELNNKIRDYNAIAPSSVRKTYIRLSDELDRIYKETAPLIENEIETRANMPKIKTGSGGFVIHVDNFKEFLKPPAEGQVDHFVDKSQPFGFKEWWRSLFNYSDEYKYNENKNMHS